MVYVTVVAIVLVGALLWRRLPRRARRKSFEQWL